MADQSQSRNIPLHPRTSVRSGVVHSLASLLLAATWVGTLVGTFATQTDEGTLETLAAIAAGEGADVPALTPDRDAVKAPLGATDADRDSRAHPPDPDARDRHWTSDESAAGTRPDRVH